MVEDLLRVKLTNHFERCGVIPTSTRDESFSPNKEQYRAAHLYQRLEKINSSENFLNKKLHKLMHYFADGSDVVPENIDVEIELVESGKLSSDLFRMATLNWSVPVSEGYGRRLRFLVWDASNRKIIGIFALGDAVFNIKSRDDYLGWSPLDRKDKLVNIMDAYVLGAVPPYNQLLCGKLIASLVQSKEVSEAFRTKYKDSVGVISKEKKDPYLCAVTVTSALGRSSIYNRLSLNGEKIFKKIGMTIGWGHFHVSAEIFGLIFEYLKSKDDALATSYEFGGGPNWKIRIIKRALIRLGLQENLMKHGFKREVYICEIAKNCKDFLTQRECAPDFSNLRTVSEISQIAKERWVIPRSIRNQGYKDHVKLDFLRNIRA